VQSAPLKTGDQTSDLVTLLFRQYRFQTMGLPPIRSHGQNKHGDPPGSGRRCRSNQGNSPSAGNVLRWQWTLLLRTSRRSQADCC
jgi:hypothetical protein